MQRIVNCELTINSIINDKKEKNVIRGKGYYKCDDSVIVYFSSDDMKYKYEYKDGELVVYCNDSVYCFCLNDKKNGEIKNGDYIFKITTLASKIEVSSNCIVLNYRLYQNDFLIGYYETILSFN